MGISYTDLWTSLILVVKKIGMHTSLSLFNTPDNLDGEYISNVSNFKE